MENAVSLYLFSMENAAVTTYLLESIFHADMNPKESSSKYWITTLE